MDLDAVRRFALSLPESTEEPHFAASSFRVKGKIFCTVPPEGDRLHVPIGTAEEVDALIAGDGGAFEALVWGQRVVPDWVRVNLAAADAAQVREILEDAWRRKAPKRVAAAFDASR